MARRLIAAAEPRRHLPWEGFTDAYRDLMRPRGIPEAGFLKIWASGLKKAVRQRYSIIERQIEHPLRDSWWQSLVPDVERINIPTLVCGSFSDNNLHSRGSFRGFSMIKSSERHLYTHRTGKWATFYANEARQTQLDFFDRHLRGRDSPALPTVRLEVRADRTTVTAVRNETDWPLPRTRWTDLHLDTTGLLLTPATRASHLTFPVTARGLSFGHIFSTDTELTGPMTAHLWVELHDTDDADLFVGVEKWDGNRYVPFEGSYGFGRDRITTGWQRISLRGLSANEPSDFSASRPLEPGEIAEVTIELGPSATYFAAGQAIRLVIAGRWLWPRNPLTGQFPAAYKSLRRGRCTVYWGPDRPSRLTVPIIPILE
jgi:putative CocE/NonD family hydrolase